MNMDIREVLLIPAIYCRGLSRALGIALGAALALFCLAQPAHAQWHERSADAMGTRIRVELWATDPALADLVLTAVMHEMHRVDRAYSPYRDDSELSELNQTAAAGWVSVSDELFELLKRSAWVSKLTNGAFDVTFASAGRYYDYRASKRPSQRELDAAVEHIDYRHIQLRPRSSTNQPSVRYAMDQVYVDLGGIAKGYAVDRAIKIIAEQGITQASVAAGGDSRILGDRRGQPWTVGVRHPRNAKEVAVLLPLEDTAVSTSGDYERFFMQDGVRYHHILDPSTGRSASGAISVTVLGSQTTLTDALSTSVFVLGPEAGLALVNRLEGIDAIIIDGTGQMRYSDGLAGLDAVD